MVEPPKNGGRKIDFLTEVDFRLDSKMSLDKNCARTEPL